MRKYIFNHILLSLLGVLISNHSFSQALADSISQQSALHTGIKFFNASLGTHSPVYNGRQYYFYDPAIKGNAYFQDNFDFKPGSVDYNGTLCTEVPMLYDLNGQKVVILLFDHFSTLSLIDEKVKSFDFLNHHFININADTLVNTNSAGMRTGYYDELYKEKIEVLVRRSKSIQSNAGDVERHFKYSADFYFKKNNAYYKINNLKGILEVLKDRKVELQQYIKSSKINFRKDPEGALVKISSYYDHLAN